MRILFQDITHSWDAPISELETRENDEWLEVFHGGVENVMQWRRWGKLNEPFNTNEEMTVREAVNAGAKIILRGSAVEMVLI